ncbi:hypothetical protein, partial [Desulfobulbus alkaliphilus]|uniref:hypothetical protein n=1 Tax=Desulfobulbus alkaliphilus TaxID=869814 RepID=UPI0019625C77
MNIDTFFINTDIAIAVIDVTKLKSFCETFKSSDFDINIFVESQNSLYGKDKNNFHFELVNKKACEIFGIDHLNELNKNIEIIFK